MNINKNSTNAIADSEYHKAAFSLRNKFYRFLWDFSWFILCSWTPNFMHGWRAFILRFFGARIGKSNHIYPSCKIWSPKLLYTEDAVTIGPKAVIYNPGGVSLGHHTVISQNAYICGATHDFNKIEFDYIKKEIFIESFVWIAAYAIVLPGVICREGSILGAGAVTSRNLDAWSVYAGNPAKYVKARNNFLVNQGR